MTAFLFYKKVLQTSQTLSCLPIIIKNEQVLCFDKKISMLQYRKIVSYFILRGKCMARIELPEIFQDGMMLQRDKTIKVWGTVTGAKRLRISLCNDMEEAEIHGVTFYCELSKQNAGVGLTLSIFVDEEEAPEVTISNISIGDIYIAAGQSNMEYFLRYDAHWNDVKKWERNDDIHMFNCKRIAFEGQKRELPDSGSWFLEHDFQWETFLHRDIPLPHLCSRSLAFQWVLLAVTGAGHLPVPGWTGPVLMKNRYMFLKKSINRPYLLCQKKRLRIRAWRAGHLKTLMSIRLTGEP